MSNDDSQLDIPAGAPIVTGRSGKSSATVAVIVVSVGP